MKTRQTALAAFKPNSQESKAKTTDNAARAIMDSEATAREAKTARLRAARLVMEAQAEPVLPKTKPVKAKAAKKAK